MQVPKAGGRLLGAVLNYVTADGGRDSYYNYYGYRARAQAEEAVPSADSH
jgi:hypothetical protein